jgi:hypothetical protein
VKLYNLQGTWYGCQSDEQRFGKENHLIRASKDFLKTLFLSLWGGSGTFAFIGYDSDGRELNICTAIT